MFIKKFNINLLQPKYQLQQVDRIDVGRRYKLPDGQMVPSVTTILKPLTAEAVDKWRQDIGVEKARVITSRAGRRGTIVHQLAEQYLTNQPIVYPNQFIRNGFKQIKQQLDAHVDNIRAIEYPLYSTELQLAGTTDCIAEWANRLSIIDFKNARNSREEYLNYQLQVAAYAKMANQMYGLQITQGVVIIAIDHDLSKTLVFDVEQFYPQLQAMIGQFYEKNV